jgi:hypothetical protein
MIRRFNYTGRVLIRRPDTRVTLTNADKQFAFDADLNLAGYNLASDARVFVEAYRQTTWMRFDFGRIGAIQPPNDRRLIEFDSPEGILFRVKVTALGEKHTLLAEADRIPLAKIEEEETPRTPLLPVKPQKLGDEIYRLDFSSPGNRPLLLINSDAGQYSLIARSPAFMSLVYPALFREVLVRVLVVDEHDDYDNADDWRSQWVRFAMLSPGLGEIPKPDEIEDRFDWIEKAVASFAKRIQVRSKFADFWREGSKQ